MRLSPRYLLNYRKTYFSQDGEDGLLEYILYKLPNRNNWCVEFGAWDGQHLSNTFYFLSKKNYNAIMIEGLKERYNSLLELKNIYSNLICLNKFVEIGGENSLDNILGCTEIPKDFDLLSIDIDGNDYHVWESLKSFYPKVVIIEINIRDKPDIYKINKICSPVIDGESGTSLLALTELAKEKGYSLISQISCNAIFVKNEYYKIYHKKVWNTSDFFTFEGHDKKELNLHDKVRRRLEKIRKKKYAPLHNLLR